MTYLKRILFCLALLFASAHAAKSQTVESVLRAVNERRTALGDGPIQWPDLTSPNPPDGAITSVDHALRCMKEAAAQINSLSKRYLAYDVKRKTWINTRHFINGFDSITVVNPTGFSWDYKNSDADNNTQFKGSHLDIFSINPDEIDLGNWREKLIQLASNINQFRAFQINTSGTKTHPTGLLNTQVYEAPPIVDTEDCRIHPLPFYYAKYNLEIQLKFPHLVGPAATPMTPSASARAPATACPAPSERRTWYWQTDCHTHCP